MFSLLSILTVADDGGKQRYINNENWSDKEKWTPGEKNSPQKRHYILRKIK